MQSCLSKSGLGQALLRFAVITAIVATATPAVRAQTPAPAAPTVGATVEGVQFDESVTVGGSKLVLNGAGFRKRGFFKTDVSAIYLQQKTTTLESIYKLRGAKRILLYVLKDIPGATISRYFVNDFKLVSTDDEFKQLINEIGAIGQVYSSLPKVSKGDVVAIDWVPGKGIACSYNGKSLAIDGTNYYLNSELMYQIFLRIYVGPAVPEELRLNLLGQSRSMSTSAVTAER